MFKFEFVRARRRRGRRIAFLCVLFGLFGALERVHQQAH
jgi:hypothetical protein